MVVSGRRSHVIILLIIVVSAALAQEVGGTFVFVSASIVLEAANCIVDVSRAELVELLVASKYNDRYVDLAENAQLKGLLE